MSEVDLLEVSVVTFYLCVKVMIDEAEQRVDSVYDSVCCCDVGLNDSRLDTVMTRMNCHVTPAIQSINQQRNQEINRKINQEINQSTMTIYKAQTKSKISNGRRPIMHICTLIRTHSLLTGACLCKHTVYWCVAAIALYKTETTKSPSINVEFC